MPTYCFIAKYNPGWELVFLSKQDGPNTKPTFGDKEPLLFIYGSEQLQDALEYAKEYYNENIFTVKLELLIP